MMQVTIQEETLTDNSSVFNAIVTDGHNRLEFACTSEKDAHDFAFGVAELINKHTVEGHCQVK